MRVVVLEHSLQVYWWCSDSDSDVNRSLKVHNAWKLSDEDIKKAAIAMSGVDSKSPIVIARVEKANRDELIQATVFIIAVIIGIGLSAFLGVYLATLHHG